MERKPLTFIEILAIVWKVLFAILLIPALLLLIYVGLHVFDPVTVIVAALALVIAGGTVLSRRKRA